MVRKRGISPLIATVLLVGFAVALGALVSTYVIKQAKEFKPESFIEESTYCENIAIEPVILQGAVVQATSTPSSGQDPTLAAGSCGVTGVCLIQGISVKNKGSFSLHRLTIKAPGLPPTDYLYKSPAPGPAEGVTCEAGAPTCSIPPGKVWSYRRLAVAYKPASAGQDAEGSKVTLTPHVLDREKGKVLPCPKQEVSFDIRDVCKDPASPAGSLKCPIA